MLRFIQLLIILAVSWAFAGAAHAPTIWHSAGLYFFGISFLIWGVLERQEED